MPQVSVIIPAYNANKFIEETLQSVFNQSFQGFEVIVVDDGSTDSTQEVLTNYQSKIKILTKTNGGPASARNLGIQKSTGEYIAFLDADDI